MRNLVAFAFIVLVALIAQPAIAATEYPSTLVEQTCTDAASTTSTGYSQVGGSTDKKCDHDRRILTGAIVADTTFGPFPGGRSACFIVFLDGNTVTGGDTKWDVIVQVKQPHNAEMESVDSITTLVTGAGDAVYMIGLPTGFAFDSLTESLNVRLPDAWYLKLDLKTATSWTGEISMVGC